MDVAALARSLPRSGAMDTQTPAPRTAQRFPVRLRTGWLDFAPALQWHTGRRLQSALRPFRTRIRHVNVRVSDAPGEVDARQCEIGVVMQSGQAVRASATARGAYESVDLAADRVRALVRRHIRTEQAIRDPLSRIA